jgi:hypothetical protein
MTDSLQSSSPETETLKPCPFCDGRMKEVTDEDGHYWAHPDTECWLSEAWVSDELTGEGSIGEWNTRPAGLAPVSPGSLVSITATLLYLLKMARRLDWASDPSMSTFKAAVDKAIADAEAAGLAPTPDLKAENEALRHDLDRHMKIAADCLNEVAQKPKDREAIARIIDPTAKFEDFEGIVWSKFGIQRRELAYQKADAILALSDTSTLCKSENGK